MNTPANLSCVVLMNCTYIFILFYISKQQYATSANAHWFTAAARNDCAHSLISNEIVNEKTDYTSNPNISEPFIRTVLSNGCITSLSSTMNILSKNKWIFIGRIKHFDIELIEKERCDKNFIGVIFRTFRHFMTISEHIPYGCSDFNDFSTQMYTCYRENCIVAQVVRKIKIVSSFSFV